MILDTDVASRLLAGDREIRRHLKRADETSSQGVMISAIAVLEMANGIAQVASSQKKSALKMQLTKGLSGLSVASFDADDALLFSEIFALVGSQIDEKDCMIAAQAMTRDVEVATLNIKHFSRVPGLRIAAWCMALSAK